MWNLFFSKCIQWKNRDIYSFCLRYAGIVSAKSRNKTKSITTLSKLVLQVFPGARKYTTKPLPLISTFQDAPTSLHTPTYKLKLILHSYITINTNWIHINVYDDVTSWSRANATCANSYRRILMTRVWPQSSFTRSGWAVWT